MGLPESMKERGGARDRLGALLRGSRLAAGLELVIVLGILLLKPLGVIRNPSLAILLFGWLSLWVRRKGWRELGLARPARWGATLAAGVLIGVAYDALDIRVLVPLLHRLTGEPLDLSELDSLRGNLGQLLLLIGVTWPLAAVAEEMTYRGYLLNRLADLFGRGGPRWAPSVALVTLTFGLSHGWQGVTGVADNLIAGLLFAVLYLASGRNLWLPIVVHGVVDTTSFVLLYLGYRLG